MINALEYRIVTSYLELGTKSDFIENSQLSSSILNGQLRSMIEDIESDKREVVSEIVSHSLTKTEKGFIFSVLFHLKEL